MFPNSILVLGSGSALERGRRKAGRVGRRKAPLRLPSQRSQDASLWIGKVQVSDPAWGMQVTHLPLELVSQCLLSYQASTESEVPQVSSQTYYFLYKTVASFVWI
jgi:hypothetical protein